MSARFGSAETPSLFDALETGATAVTATRRLARELVSQFDQQQLSAGKKAWSSADILPWDSWVERSWLEHRKHGETHPVLLSDSQLLAVWCQIINDDIARHEADSQPLWNVRGSAQAAIRALQLIRQWQIDPNAVAASAHVDHRGFSRWLHQYDQKCLSKHWTDRYSLPDLVASLEFPLGRLQLCGFDRVLPQQQHLLQHCRNSGWQIEMPSVKPATEFAVQTRLFSDEAAHWTGAATWARGQLELDSQARIGVIMPNPAKSRALAESGFRQILCPEQVVNPLAESCDSGTLPFHISLGIPLSDYPPVSAALDLLSTLILQKVPVDLLVSVVRSPWLRGAGSEGQSRSECERMLRKHLPIKTDCASLIAQIDYASQKAGQPFCPLLQQLLSDCITALSVVTGKHAYTRWIELFEQLLAAAGWPEEQLLNSREFQVVEAFRVQLRGLSELDFDGIPVDGKEALQALRQRMQQQIFQIENRDAPVQLMGIAESAGLQFDHLWFGSLVAEEWPPASRPNPFIPVALQRDAGFERASVEASQRFAVNVQERLLNSSKNIVFGLHQFDQEVAVEPSALIAGVSKPPQTVTNPGLDVMSHFHVAKPDALEQRVDAGTEVINPASIRGGTSLMQSAAVCPRGAYVRFRLGASEIELNAPGLDPAERGTLVHQTLELAWKALGDSATLRQTEHSALTELILSCARESSRRYRVTSGFGEQFFGRVHQWLLATLHEWFALEQQRSEPFTVLAEQSASIELAGLPLNFKIDRIDRLPNGKLVLIDYKTGIANRISAWREARITEPQLPLYALSQMLKNQSIEAVAFGRVRLGECELQGLAATEGFGDPSEKAIKVPAINESKIFSETFGDWQTCLDHWQRSLTQVAAEFHQGDIRIAPDQDGLCANCPTPAICRSGSFTGVSTA